MYGVGVDRVDEISQIAILAGIIKQGGAWFRFEENGGEIRELDGVIYKWQGRNNFVQFLYDNPMFVMELEDRLRGVHVEAPKCAPVAEDGYSIIEEDAVKEALLV